MHKKYTVWLFALLLTACEQKQPEAFTVQGSIKNLEHSVEKVMVKSMEQGDTSVYEAFVNDGTYTMKGTVNGPIYMNIIPIYAKDVDRNKLNDPITFFYLEPGKIEIQHKTSFSNMTVAGSAAEEDAKKLQDEMARQNLTRPLDDAGRKVYHNFMTAHPSSPIMVYLIREYCEVKVAEPSTLYEDLPFSMRGVFAAYSTRRIDATSAEPLFRELPDYLRQSMAGMNLEKEIEFGKIYKAMNPFISILDSLGHLYKNKKETDETRRLAADIELKMLDVVAQIQEQVYAKYIRQYPTSPIVISILNTYANYQWEVKAGELFDQLPESIQQTDEGRAINQRLLSTLKTAVGSVAPDFAQADTSGNKIQLSDFRGKYVLLDFWASWCAPCRAQNPHLVQVFNRHQKDNFTIIGISLDEKKAPWTKAIKKDGLTWINISDLKGEQNEVALLYKVFGIPSSLLIAPDGRIVAKNVTGAMLDKTLEEALRHKTNQ